jgi:hypothetical protein
MAARKPKKEAANPKEGGLRRVYESSIRSCA